jgi:hypothetical protein
MTDNATTISMDTYSTSSLVENEVSSEELLEIKEEWLFDYKKSDAYTSCEATLSNPRFFESHSQLCDVYQVTEIKDNEPNTQLTTLRNFIDSKGGEVYASRIDIEADPLDDIAYPVLTVWTSKTSFDKWHFVNDHIIENQTMIRYDSKARGDVGCIDSHRRMLFRVQSIAFTMCEKRERSCTVLKFEKPCGRKVLHQMKCTVSYRVQHQYEGHELTIDAKELRGQYNTGSEFAVVYVFYPRRQGIHPNLKCFVPRRIKLEP